MKKIELVEIKNNRHFIVDMMYCGTENMMMTDVYGQIGLGNRCFVHPDVAKLLENLKAPLKENGWRLKFCDAYRPPVAFKVMKKIIPQPGFFAACAEKSQHCYATAIDVTLVDENGRELDFPCRVDAYERKYAEQLARGEWDEFNAHLEKAKYSWNAPEDAAKIANRDNFRKMMEEAGFKALEHEWWHFNLSGKEMYSMVNFEIAENGEFVFSIND